MQVDLFEMMHDLFTAQGIQVMIFKNDFSQIEQWDYGFRKQFFAGYDYHREKNVLMNLLAAEILYYYEDDLKLNYSMMLYDGEVICFGPVLFQPATTDDISSLINRYHIAVQFTTDIQEFYNRIPVYPSYDHWNNTLGFFFTRLLGRAVSSHYVLDRHPEMFSVNYSDYEIPTDAAVPLKLIEERYAVESEMLNAVSSGKYDEARQAHYRFRQYKIAPRIADPIRNSKNFLFTFNTLLRKAAQEGYVHPLHIDNLSRQFSIQIEACSTDAQLKELRADMLRKYCNLVETCSRRKYSKLVQTCMDYIDFNYTSELSLSSLAVLCAVSRSYLSAQFAREAGMTLTAYINRVRIAQAKILLNTTKLSIQEISDRCGFSDANYFTRLFKKLQGLSPKLYRDKGN